MANTEQFDLEDVANLDEAKYESGGKREGEEEEEEEESSKKPHGKKMKKCEEETEVSEDTLAASSLHPAARHSDPMPKVAAMHGVMNMMSGMSKSDKIGRAHV